MTKRPQTILFGEVWWRALWSKGIQTWLIHSTVNPDHIHVIERENGNMSANETRNVQQKQHKSGGKYNIFNINVKIYVCL